MGRIRKCVEFPHPIEKVWYALTEPRIIAAWLAENDFEPTVGHSFEFRLEPQPGFDGIVRCEVLEVDAPTTLAYSWRGGPVDTIVHFTLERTSKTTTTLTLEQTGFQGLRANLVRLIMGAGWGKIGKEIGKLLDRLDDDGVLAPIPLAPKRRFVLWRVLAAILTPWLKKGEQGAKEE